MWAEACQLLEQAERLQRQFFRLASPPGARISWEPPVDVFENEDEITVVVALPGVSPDRVEVTHEPRSLLIRAEGRIPFEDRGYSIGRIEIPYGYFERRVPLPAVQLEPGIPRWADGCLILSLRKRP
jgi:HSP20 family molecular chaperone IbpA